MLVGLPGGVASYLKMNKVVQSAQLPALSWVRILR